MSLSPISSEENVSPATLSRIQLLRNDLRRLLDNGENSDVTFKVEDREIKAHMNILAARSIYFNNLFKADLVETKIRQVDITDFKYEVVQEMLRYIYTAEVPRLFDLATDLLIAADKYQLDELKRMCEQELSSMMSPSKAINTFILGRNYNLELLKEKAADYINENLKKVKADPNWFEIHKDLESVKYLHVRATDYIAAKKFKRA